MRESTAGINGLKGGNLLAIPFRLLLALQADGWLVRNDVVWSKVAPMPESVSGTHWERHQVKVRPGRPPAEQEHMPDEGQRPGGNRGNQWGDVQHQPNAQWSDCPGCPRCSATGGYVLRRGSWRHTRSHETCLMLTKQMCYYSDQERVRERQSETSHGGNGANPGQKQVDLNQNAGALGQTPHQVGAAGRNPRDVLTPAPSPFKGEHYAAFPAGLITPLILSSAPLKCCPVCGAGWAVVVERSKATQTNPRPFSKDGNGDRNDTLRIYEEMENNVIGYRPTCQCNAADWLPGLVLDPFAGSGTTGLVCRELGLRFVGLDISGEYLRDIALVRSERLTPDSSMVNLPLFTLLQS